MHSAIAGVSVRTCRGRPECYWRTIVADMTCVAALTLLMVNLRWNAWILSFAGDAREFPWDGWARWAFNGLLVVVFGVLLLALLIQGRKVQSHRQDGDSQKPPA